LAELQMENAESRVEALVKQGCTYEEAVDKVVEEGSIEGHKRSMERLESKRENTRRLLELKGED
jgi:hypothetical protein